MDSPQYNVRSVGRCCRRIENKVFLPTRSGADDDARILGAECSFSASSTLVGEAQDKQTISQHTHYSCASLAVSTKWEAGNGGGGRSDISNEVDQSTFRFPSSALQHGSSMFHRLLIRGDDATDADGGRLSCLLRKERKQTRNEWRPSYVIVLSTFTFDEGPRIIKLIPVGGKLSLG